MFKSSRGSEAVLSCLLVQIKQRLDSQKEYLTKKHVCISIIFKTIL